MANETIMRAVNTYGTKQLGIIQEELSELIQAISKYRRSLDEDFNKEKALDMVTEEVADVVICLEQLELLLEDKEGINFNELINAKYDYKIKRIKNKLDRVAEKKCREIREVVEVNTRDVLGDIATHNNRISQRIKRVMEKKR